MKKERSEEGTSDRTWQRPSLLNGFTTVHVCSSSWMSLLGCRPKIWERWVVSNYPTAADKMQSRTG
jgi:hypothetical protein